MKTFVLSFFFALALVAGTAEANPLGLNGGNKTKIEKHPYQVAIYQDDIFIGSAVILNKYWIVSGARYYWSDLNRLSVYAGRTKLNESTKIDYGVRKVVYHPDFSLGLNYAVTLCKLKKPLKFGSKVKKIELAESSDVHSGIVSGWGGNMSQIFKPTNDLMEVTLSVLNAEDCSSRFPIPLNLFTVICSWDESGSGPTILDMGDPLVANSKLVGVFGGIIASPTDYPGFFTDVTVLKDWITETIKK